MPFTAYVFTSAQLVDIRRHCGYPLYGDGATVFPAPWVYRKYLAIEYRLQHMSTDEGNVVVNTYLANLTTLETAIPASSANLDTDQAAVWKHNRDEVAHRSQLFDSWRRRLCNFLGVPPGPNFGGSSNALVV
ncbi:hypothetical protein AB4Y32_15990 [Paraburkholderia phymatum]|uniref:Uncharacterized protein n=1 Tax=Paraburkholderia phymatum TaxID=148447 RepID=A0ACC6U114_9BURK